MRSNPLTLAVLFAFAAAGVVGCYIEPYSEPIRIPSGTVPPPYSPQSQGGVGPTASTRAVAIGSNPRPNWPGTVTTAPASTTQAAPLVIDERVREQVAAAAQASIMRRFGVDGDPKLNEYLILVGSLVTISTPEPDVEYRYVLLETDEPISCAVWPKTICVSRGMFKQMEDESELAGVLAREISNLQSGRTLAAAGLPVPEKAVTRPATTRASATTVATTSPSQPLTAAQAAAVGGLSSKLMGVLLKEPANAAVEQAADLEGARFAAAAKYAPDGFLRLLTRLKPPAATTATTAPSGWDRIKALDADVQIVAKAHPQATVRLPARFESYVKAAARTDAAANP
jgi:predicted Zn-dependent protease